MNIKQYIGDRQFYKTVLTVALPITVQNLITNFVSMLDNVMVGSLGTEEMSGVSIVNQLFFIFNLAVFGALSGAGIFTAQYHGKKDDEGIRYTVRFKLMISLILFVSAVFIFIFFGENLINLSLHDTDGTADITMTMQFAKQYLSTILYGLLPFALSMCFSSTLRETGETVAPMVAGLIAVFTNCVFNYLLIFGKFGFPNLGVVGAGIATNLSRYVECIIIIVYTFSKSKRFTYIKGAFTSLYIPKDVFKSITVKGMPLLLNEFLWALGMSLLSVAYSLHGLSVLAGYSISSTVMNLANISFVALGSSIGIIIGKELGAGDYNKAIDDDRKLIAFSLGISAVIAAIMVAVGGLIPKIYNTSPESKEYAAFLIRTASAFIPLNAFANAAYFTIRSGGKTFVTFLFDSVFVMLVSVPLGFGLYYIFHLNIYTVYPIVLAADFLKCVFGYVLIKKRVWVNNIVG